MSSNLRAGSQLQASPPREEADDASDEADDSQQPDQVDEVPKSKTKMWIAIGVVSAAVLAVLGFVAYKVFFPKTTTTPAATAAAATAATSAQTPAASTTAPTAQTPAATPAAAPAVVAPPPPPPKNIGRYVRLFHERTTTAWLNIAEINVMSGGTNVASGKPVTLSSLFAPIYPGSQGVNGNPQTFLHTSTDSPWIEIDLGADVKIDSITVLNRMDCCRARVVGARLALFPSSVTARSTPLTSALWVSDKFRDASGRDAPVADNMDGFYRYVATLPATTVSGSDV